jgi:putative ABC transport system permease protein
VISFFLTKEVKKYPFFFLLLFFTLLLGTMGLLGISIVSTKVQEKLESNANELLTSDLAVSARRELHAHELSALGDALKSIPHKTYKISDVYSMVTHLASKASRLVEIRATQEGFPFYGKISVEEGIFEGERLFISKDLADLWQIRSGDELKIGELTLPVSGIVKEDTSLGLRGFSLAPRIYLPLRLLEKSGLLKPGSTGNFAHHFLIHEREKIPELKKLIYEKIQDTAVKIVLPADSSEQTGRVINTLTNFMALAALIGLILSLVGIFYLYQSHLLARLRDLCLLYLHGLSKVRIVFGIVLQFGLVFALVVLAELLVILPLFDKISPFLSENLGIELTGDLSLLDTLSEIPFLFLLSLLILVPVLMGLLRTPMGLQLKAAKLSLGRFRFFDFLPFLLALWLYSSYLAHSFRTGNLFFFSLLLVFGSSTLVVRLFQKLIRFLVKGKGLLLPTVEAGVALRNLFRSGHKLTLSFLSLALGATLISLILQLDDMIAKEFSLDQGKPSLFVFDIQEDQMKPLQELATSLGTPLIYETPLIRGRLEKVNGKKFVRKKKAYDFRSREEDEDARFRNNGMNLTYRGYLTLSERIVEGEPFPEGGASSGRLPYLSIEKRWSERMGIEIGDQLTFDIQGIEFEAQVRNIREVKWTSFYPNFFVTVEPSMIELAPKTYLAILPTVTKEQKVSLQRQAVEQFPNISFIDVGELIRKLSVLFEKSRGAIEIISWLSLTVGLVILYGLSLDQVYRRYYDLALLKSLGLTANRLRLNLLYEFGALFMSALSLGFFLGWLIAQVIGKEVFKLSMSVNWEKIFVPGGLLTVLCLGTILLSSWRAVRSRPRELLSDS